MNKLIKITFFILGLILFLEVTGSNNQITKIFHHQGMITDNIVCYLMNDPICNKLANSPRNDATKKLESFVIFLPQTQLQSSEVKSMAQKVHNTKRDGYTITFNQVTAPMNGVKISITYDSAKVVCDYQTFNAITGDKGLVISLHNKQMLSKIKSSTDSLIQYALNKVENELRPCVWIDPGHGGSDEGKVGFYKVKEKNISYQVATKVASLLKKSGCDVFLSRSGDYFVALDERTSNANRKKADIFLSIHANSAPNDASGIETFCLDSSLMKGGLFTNDPMLQMLTVQRDKINNLLAQSVHTAALDAARKVYDVKDRKVKKSVSQVLLGTDITVSTALIEIGFLSNQAETKLLMDSAYQMKLAQGIAQGVLNYLKKTL